MTTGRINQVNALPINRSVVQVPPARVRRERNRAEEKKESRVPKRIWETFPNLGPVPSLLRPRPRDFGQLRGIIIRVVKIAWGKEYRYSLRSRKVNEGDA